MKQKFDCDVQELIIRNRMEQEELEKERLATEREYAEMDNSI